MIGEITGTHYKVAGRYIIHKGGFYSETAGEFVISPNRRTKLFS